MTMGLSTAHEKKHGRRLCKKFRMQGAQAGKGRGVLFVR